MPIYEYLCPHCGRKVSLFYFSVRQAEAEPACPGCGGRGLKRLFSRFAVHKSEADRMAELGSAIDHPTEEYYKDSRNIGLWAKKRLKELGVEPPPGFDEVVEKARSGELLKEYETPWSERTTNP